MNRILSDITAKINENRRIDGQEALVLLENADLLHLAALADAKRKQRHSDPRVTYVVDRNINYTNICVSGCRFCAFYRQPGHAEGFILSEAELREKIEETVALGGTQILLQGGMHPDLDLDYYLNLLTFIKANFPVHIHGFSPPEISFMAEKSGKSLHETIRALMQAGLDSIPGGGAEILVDEIRSKVSPGKCLSDRWLEVMRVAHEMGLRTTATMMFGHIEAKRHIIDHLLKIRALQDETGGFTAFIPWTFQPDNTCIEVEKATAAEYLRVLALCRLVLDNIDNIQASWVTQGAKIAQAALAFGANDLGSTMIEENVVAAAGVRYRLPLSEMKRLIISAGYEPRQRDCHYNLISEDD
jgi:cyclic dehypoxanthinyl futalosine synthase